LGGVVSSGFFNHLNLPQPLSTSLNMNILNAFKKNDQNKLLLVTTPEDAPAGTSLYETRQKQIYGDK
jgi:hypothetical protein